MTQYLISLCRPLNVSSVDCGLNSSVCMISDGNAKSIGNTVEEFTDSILTENPTTRELILQLEGDQCMDSGQLHKTVIIFKCGKTLVCDCLLYKYLVYVYCVLVYAAYFLHCVYSVSFLCGNFEL